MYRRCLAIGWSSQDSRIEEEPRGGGGPNSIVLEE